MVYVALAQALIIVVLVVLLNRARNHEVQAVLDVMAANDTERAQLLNRIQRPDLLPTIGPPGRPANKPKDAGELAKVGSVRLTPPPPAASEGDA